MAHPLSINFGDAESCEVDYFTWGIKVITT
jgi:hypothetical protein